MNADVVAVDVLGRMLFGSGVEAKSNPLLQFVQKPMGRPSVAQEEKFQAGAFAMLAQDIGVAEQFRNALDHREHLVPLNKGVEARAEIRFGRQTSRNSQRKSNLGLSSYSASNRGQANVVNFRVGAPRVASGNRYLEFARQVIEIGIARKQLRSLQNERRGIDYLVGIHAGNRASSHVSDN